MNRGSRISLLSIVCLYIILRNVSSEKKLRTVSHRLISLNRWEFTRDDLFFYRVKTCHYSFNVALSPTIFDLLFRVLGNFFAFNAAYSLLKFETICFGNKSS